MIDSLVSSGRYTKTHSAMKSVGSSADRMGGSPPGPGARREGPIVDVRSRRSPGIRLYTGDLREVPPCSTEVSEISYQMGSSPKTTPGSEGA